MRLLQIGLYIFLLASCNQESRYSTHFETDDTSPQVFAIENFPAEWSEIISRSDETIVFKPCGANIRGISIDAKNNILYDYMGSDTFVQNIEGNEQTGHNTFVFYCRPQLNDTTLYTYRFVSEDKYIIHRGYWEIDYPEQKIKYFAVKNKHIPNYQIIYTPCTECNKNCNEIYPPDWINGKSIEYYLNHNQISDIGKLYMLGKYKLGTDYLSFSLADSLLTQNNQTRPFYFLIFNRLYQSDNILIKRLMPEIAYRYINTHSREFFRLTATITTQTNIIKSWAFIIQNHIEHTSYNKYQKSKMIVQLIDNLKNNSTGMNENEYKALMLFVKYLKAKG